MSKKINLNTEIYCPMAIIKHGDDDCEHEFPEVKYKDEDDFCAYKCSKCGRILYFEVWD